MPMSSSPSTKALPQQPDAVLVCTPSNFHVPVALAAARAGCHLFIEKPVSHSWEGVECLLEEVRSRDLTTLMGFDLRFDPGLLKIKELLAAKTIGHVVAAHVEVGQYLPDWHPWEDYRFTPSAKQSSGGGVILDLIHELDYISWLLGPVADLTAMSGHVSRLEIETEDVAAILLRFETGAIATIQLDYLQRPPSRTCRLIGESGTIEWNYFGRFVRWHVAGGEGWQQFDIPSSSATTVSYLKCLTGWAASAATRNLSWMSMSAPAFFVSPWRPRLRLYDSSYHWSDLVLAAVRKECSGRRCAR